MKFLIQILIFISHLAIATSSVAEESLDRLVAEATNQFITASDGDRNSRTKKYQQVRAVLDRITLEHPTSETALQILLSETVGGIDIAALNMFLNNPNADFPPSLTSSENKINLTNLAEDAQFGSSDLFRPICLLIGSSLDGLNCPYIDVESCPGEACLQSGIAKILSTQNFLSAPRSGQDVFRAKEGEFLLFDSPNVYSIPCKGRISDPGQNNNFTLGATVYRLAYSGEGTYVHLVDGVRHGGDLSMSFEYDEVCFEVFEYWSRFHNEQGKIGWGLVNHEVMVGLSRYDRLDNVPTWVTESSSAIIGIEIGSGTVQTESALDLSRNVRREIQRRLLLLGHDPRGVDGIFGPGSRAAISSWQSVQGNQSSGFLNSLNLDALKQQSESAYQKWLKEAPLQSKRANSQVVRGVRWTKRQDSDGIWYCKPCNGGFWCSGKTTGSICQQFRPAGWK